MKHRHQFRPEFMIFTVFPVLPPSIRPCISPGGDEKQDDDLTDKLVSILKANNKLQQLTSLKLQRICTCHFQQTPCI